MYRELPDSRAQATERKAIKHFTIPLGKPEVQQLQSKKYKVKVFSAGQSQSQAHESITPEMERTPEIDRDFFNDEFERPYSKTELQNRYNEAESRLSRRPEPYSYNPVQPVESSLYYDIVSQSKKRSWWKGYMPKVLVFLFIASILFFMFRPVSAEDSGTLSINLPQMLAKMLPSLNIFVQATGDDLVKIGKSYTTNSAASGQSLAPEQSLDSLISGIKDINKEMGNTSADDGMWDQIQKIFKSTRQEAWSQAARSGK